MNNPAGLGPPQGSACKKITVILLFDFIKKISGCNLLKYYITLRINYNLKKKPCYVLKNKFRTRTFLLKDNKDDKLQRRSLDF